MSSRGKVTVTGTLLTLAIVGFYGVLQWQAEPQASKAVPPASDDPGPLPDNGGDEGGGDDGGSGGPYPVVASLIFVIDSSQTMYPRVGPNYFDMAKDAILDFLRRPGFKCDGRYELGIVQFTELGAPGYDEYTQWIPPTRVLDTQVSEYLYEQIATLSRSTHRSAALMEMGIHEATSILNSQAATTGVKHIILLTTGEYRLPAPCPPPCYGCENDANCCGGEPDCDDVTNDACNKNSTTDYFCKRACYIRYFARVARDSGYTVSAVRLGADWHNDKHDVSDCREDVHPYGTPPTYCEQPAEPGDPYRQLPTQPDRDGFLREITNIDDCAGDGFGVGKYARIAPALSFGCASGNCPPGTARDIADAVANWMCDWFPFDSDSDGIVDFCDNCPDLANVRQRDCDRDGIGDLCQATSLYLHCGEGTLDTDCDGLDETGESAVDVCVGGDDCLVADWVENRGCDLSSYPAECFYDCDHDDIEDACEEAIAVHDATGAPIPASTTLNTEWDRVDADQDSLPDCAHKPPFVCDCNLSGCCDAGVPSVDCDQNPESDCCVPNPQYCTLDPIPPVCDLPEITAEVTGTGRLEELFDGCFTKECCTNGLGCEKFFPDYSPPAEGADPPTLSNEAGWRLVTDSTAPNVPVTIESEPDFDYLRIGIDENGGTDPVTGDEYMPTDGTKSWFIASPEYYIPIGRCFATSCDNGIWRAPWPAYAVELTLRVHNDSDSSACSLPEAQCPDDGATYDIFLVDPEIREKAEPRRVHFRIRSNKTKEGDVDTWQMEYATSSSASPEFVVLTFDYEQNDWFRLKIMFNNSEPYTMTQEYGCVWNGAQGRVAYAYRDVLDPTDPDTTNWGSPTYFEEIGTFIPERPRGLQLQVRTNNMIVNGFRSTLDIGSIRIYPLSGCEWKNGDVCTSDCICNSHAGGGTWDCAPTSALCGTFVLDGTEECEGPQPVGSPCTDSCHCTQTCEWRCGDGITQSDQDTDGDGVYDHCEEMGWPAELCGPGTEVCDDGGATGTESTCLDDCSAVEVPPP